ncbi:MAG: DNA-binding protein [Candidatus Omnitrophica bacterium]|nr:DNA-binding protein [Candidatus Omnitrophota bacterium]
MIKLTLYICACMVFLVFGSVCAQPAESRELVSRTDLYDGKTVVYEGEAIGDIMVRGDHAWVNLHDGSYAIGVWIKREAAALITHTGGYKSKGDWVEVTGVFNKACPQHGGDLDIHGESLRIITPGALRQEMVSQDKKNIAYILAGVLCLVMIVSLFMKK